MTVREWMSVVLCCACLTGTVKAEEEEIEYAPFDGWYNNFAHPDWGAAETNLLRLLPHAYGDGVYAPSGANRPNPIAISEIAFRGPTGLGSYKNRTALLVFFGQQMVEEILDAQRPGCPPEYFNIKVPKGHHQYDPKSRGDREIPLLRTRHDQRTGFSPNVPREQINEVSAFFDGSLMYGPSKTWSDALRSFKDGLLLSIRDSDNATDTTMDFPAINDIRLPFANPPPPREHKLKPISRFFRIGNPRGNENPFLLTFGILWYRYHNYQARRLKQMNSSWSDEKLFNEARKWTIAVHQKIVYYDWLPSWLGENSSLEEYKGYDPNVHPQIAVVFQSAAMRFGHTLVPPGVYRRNANCTFRLTTSKTHFANQTALRTCNTFWNPQEAIRESDIDEILMGMMSQIAEREDNIITPDLRGNVFGPLEFSRRDLMAVNIQRGRDHGLPDYNTARQFFGLPRITNWRDINPALYDEKTKLFNELAELYNNSLDDVDIWPAGILETTPEGPGPLFRAIIRNQFTRIRSGDRFWFENYKQTKLFTAEEVEKIRNITLRDVIMQVTKIKSEDMNKDVFFFRTNDSDPCPQPAQLNHSDPSQLEECTPVQTFDYFSESEISYSLSILCLLATIFPIVGVLWYLVRQHQESVKTEQAALRTASKRKSAQLTRDAKNVTIQAIEWVDEKEGERNVTLELNNEKRLMVVKENGTKPVRTIDLSHLRQGDEIELVLSADANMRMMVIRIPKEYDLVLVFEQPHEREDCSTKVKNFLSAGGIPMKSPQVTSEKIIRKTANTKAKRQKELEKFFSEIFAHALKYEQQTSSRSSRSSTSFRETSDLINCELTKSEFADVLSLRADSLFVTNMFNLIDSNDNGYISFREFLDFFVIFSKGSAQDKARLLFDMYDLQKDGKLSKEEFKTMLRSMVDLANEKIEESQIDDLITKLLAKTGISSRETGITFEDFQKLMQDYQEELNYASLNIQIGDIKAPEFKGRRENATFKARKTIIGAYGRDKSDRSKRLSNIPAIKTIEQSSPVGPTAQAIANFVKYVENYKRQIFWLILYTLVVFGIFIERAYYYSVEREHGGLRRIAGYGVTVTRGAASAMMFTYTSLLVTMCRNLITFLRETFFHRFVPFDDAISFHKYIAFQALLFTLIHIIGHCINFYHISTQTADDLACLFRNFFHPTDFLPKFHRWCWQTITGLTGVALTIHMFIIYVFGIQYARRHTYKGFWMTHNTYPVFFVLMILHGAGRLVQPPLFYYFFLGPAILFVIDQLISVSRKKIEIAVVSAEILPSDVTYLEIRKPANFEYKSGQWVRIACLAHSKDEYHPFTLTSAPHEENLGLHIRAVGPWTIGIRRLYDPRVIMEHALPKVFLDGPYGEGHQDWGKYEVSILVGGGIGVTPFASIIKDIAHKSQSGLKFVCKKVYFIWVTRTQRHFEWMTDIIREVEDKDSRAIVSVHIFITQFKEKFDIRTTMLYICERYFQKISDRSLFTGLQSVTHFGRPDFKHFFDVIRTEHSSTSVFGVFSCGPPPMTSNVEKACAGQNKEQSGALFVHHYENF